MTRKQDAMYRLQMLSKREREILHYLLVGQTNKQTATQLCISPRTVENHRAKIFKKLEADGATACMSIVLQANGMRLDRLTIVPDEDQDSASA